MVTMTIPCVMWLFAAKRFFNWLVGTLRYYEMGLLSCAYHVDILHYKGGQEFLISEQTFAANPWQVMRQVAVCNNR